MMKMKNCRKWVCFVLIILLCVSGCGRNEGNTSMKREDSKVQIGFSFDNFVVERWQRDRDVFVSTCKDLGAEVNVQNANGDVEKQIENIQYFIDQKMDVIVVVPIVADSLSDIIKKAKEKGIKVIAYDRPILNANVDMYISFDNEMVGTLMGQALLEKLDYGDNVLMICGSEDDNNVSLVKKGFDVQMTAKAINILDVAYMKNWKAELVSGYLYEHKDLVEQVQGIMCGNDDLAREVSRYLAENRMTSQVVIVAQDADLEACQRIVGDLQYMTVFKSVETLAKNAAEVAVALAMKQDIFPTEIFFDGKYDVPYLKLTPIAVTKENMDEVIIDSGFHLKEDVYIDRPNS